MKMTIGIRAAQAAPPDYPLLKASLVAAQAATPTARACARPAVSSDPHMALHALFAADATPMPAPAGAAALGHSFSRSTPGGDERP